MSSGHYDDPKIEAQWLTEQRENVRRYLLAEGVQHDGSAAEPDWFVTPYVSIWRIESLKQPGAAGWWVISGDLPTDYLSDRNAGNARAALAGFATRWHEVSGCMLNGEEHPTIKIGCPGNRRELGDLLRRRAEIIQEWADDDKMW